MRTPTAPSKDSELGASPRSLVFANHGVAYAHLTLPVGQYETEARALEKAVFDVTPTPISARLSFLTGQSDVMLTLNVSDFRSAVHLQYVSQAMGANWLFLVPYSNQADTEPVPSALNCVIHVRFHRSAYLHLGVEFERRVVDELQQSARRHGLQCEVMAGFGWSDIVIGGTFSKAEDLRRFVISIENYDKGTAVHRVLTLVGYDRQTPPDSMPEDEVSPILFVRVRPTHIHQAVAALTRRLPSPEKWSIHSTDGKWDLILTANAFVPLRAYLEMHRRFVVEGSELSDAGIERFESHLLAKQVTPDDPSPVAISNCNCKALFDSRPPAIEDGSMNSGLPRALGRAIKNVTDLFRAASRDTTNCCDVVPSLLRCTAAGQRLVTRHRRILDRVQQLRSISGSSEVITAWLAVLARAREDIEDWCTYSERCVSQRTVGRFEEFLAQNERVVSYRGGIQKMLYIADELTDAYATQILPSESERTFVTLYDPVDTVVNMRSAGFIRVPVRYLFFLPLAITHLWHEVGVHVFFSNYSIPFDERARSRAASFFERSPSQTPQEIARIYVEVAEMYGDFITLHYGFRENLEAFAIALTSALLEQVSFHSATTLGKETFLVYLLTRLYLVVEFKVRRDLIADRLQNSPTTCMRDEIDAWRPAPQFIAESVRQLAELLNRELLSHSRYLDEPAVQIAFRELAADNFNWVVNACTDFDVAHRQFMNDLVWKLPPVARESEEGMQAFEAIQRGEVVPLGPTVDPNAVYQHLQRSMIERIRDVRRGSQNETTFLRSTAALMRSVMLSFYARDREPVPVKRQGIVNLDRPLVALSQQLPNLSFVPARSPMPQERTAS
jgi:hypothetical protein